MFDKRDDPAYLCKCIEDLTNHWFGSRGPWLAIDENKLNNTQLPQLLRWLYGFAGEWPNGNGLESIFANQDVLLPFEMLFTHDGKLVFVCENQGVWNVGTIPDGDDPPVWVRENEDGAPWLPLCHSLSQFLVTFCLHEIVFGSENVTSKQHILQEFELKGCQISPLWLEGPYVNMAADGELFENGACRPLSFHLVNGRYLVMDDYWCGTSVNEPWKEFPDLFSKAAEQTSGFSAFEPLPDQIGIPKFLQKSHLANLIRRHQTQLEYHEGKIEMYVRMYEALDKRDS